MAIWHRLVRKNAGRTECGINLWDHPRTKTTMIPGKVECSKCTKVVEKRENHVAGLRRSTQKLMKNQTG